MLKRERRAVARATCRDVRGPRPRCRRRRGNRHLEGLGGRGGDDGVSGVPNPLGDVAIEVVAPDAHRSERHDAAERDHRDLGRAGAGDGDRARDRVVDGQPQADRRGDRRLEQVRVRGAGPASRLAQCATLDGRRRSRHGEQDPGSREAADAAPLEHPVQQPRRDVKVRRRPGVHWAEGDDVAGGAADQLDRLVAEGHDRAVPRVDRDDGRLGEDEAARLRRHARHRRAHVDRERWRHCHDGRGDAQSLLLVATLSQVFRRLRYYFEMRGAGRSGSAPPPSERTWVHPSELPGSFDQAAMPPARVAGSRRFKALVATSASALLLTGGVLLAQPTDSQLAGASTGPHVATTFAALPPSDRHAAQSMLALVIYEGQHLGTATAMVLPPGDLAVTTTPVPKGASVMGGVLGQRSVALKVVGTDAQLGVTVLQLPTTVEVTPIGAARPRRVDGRRPDRTHRARRGARHDDADGVRLRRRLPHLAGRRGDGRALGDRRHPRQEPRRRIAGTLVLDGSGRAVAAQVPALGSTSFVPATFLRLLAERIVLGNASDHGWLQLVGAATSAGAAPGRRRHLPRDHLGQGARPATRSSRSTRFACAPWPTSARSSTRARRASRWTLTVAPRRSHRRSSTSSSPPRRRLGPMAGVPPNGFEGLLGDLLKAMGGAPGRRVVRRGQGRSRSSVVTDEQEALQPRPRRADPARGARRASSRCTSPR